MREIRRVLALHMIEMNGQPLHDGSRQDGSLSTRATLVRPSEFYAGLKKPASALRAQI